MTFPTYMKCSCIVILFSLLFSSCTREYSDHMRREQSPLTTFSGATPVSLEGKLSILPDEKSLEDIITHIDHAEKRIWVEIYTWTEKETIIRVIAAHKR